MKLALKVDVDTLRGTQEGVPRLIELLKKYHIGATFLFSLGPDHTGRAIKRLFRSGFMKKVSRTSVVSHYGIKTLMYGVLLPGPDISKKCADIMRSVRDAGFEIGIHTYDHVKWQDYVVDKDAAWAKQEMQLAYDCFKTIFEEPAKVHGAAGWQMSKYALRLTQSMEFDYCSDTRGSHPFIPVYNAEIVACPQLPTTLPTLDELIGFEGITKETVANHLLRLTKEPQPTGHVYTLHAELEGMKLAGVFEELIKGWQVQGYQLVSMRDLFTSLETGKLPHHEIIYKPISGRSGAMTLQGKEYLGSLHA